jgi:hypothetical protein
MKIREENRNMVLLAAVTAVSLFVAGVAALFEPASAGQQAEAIRPAYLANTTPVRVVGAPFVPNTNPRERH